MFYPETNIIPLQEKKPQQCGFIFLFGILIHTFYCRNEFPAPCLVGLGTHLCTIMRRGVLIPYMQHLPYAYQPFMKPWGFGERYTPQNRPPGGAQAG